MKIKFACSIMIPQNYTNPCGEIFLPVAYPDKVAFIYYYRGAPGWYKKL